MIRFTDMTEEQKEKIKRFVNYYDDSTIKLYTEALAKQRSIVSNEPYYEAYLNIIKRTARLIPELGCYNSISASIVFEYLLWNGYLSKDKDLVYSITDRINNTTITGADIMRGKSVCLNNADMLTRVLKEMGNESYIMGCGVFPPKGLKREYKPPIERKMIPERKNFIKKLVLSPFIKKIGNHAVTLTRVGETYYIVDPTGLSFATINDVLKAKYIGFDLEMELKPWLMLALDSGNKEEFIDTVLKSYLLSDHPIMSPAIVKDMYERVIDTCRRNHSLLDDFHDANRQDIDTVCQTLTKVKI